MANPIQSLTAASLDSARTASEADDLALLTSKRAGEMLRLAFADHGILRSWSVHQIHHRPGAGISVGYSVIIDVRNPFERRDLYAVASTAQIQEEKVLEVGGKRLRLGSTAVNIWEFPYDPELPALDLACDVEKMSQYLGESVELELIGYRPTRRAVVRVIRENKPPIFAKTIRPQVQADFEYRLKIVKGAGINCPQIYAREVGIVMMTALEGVPLSRVLAASSKHIQSEKRLEKSGARAVLRDLEGIIEALPPTAIGLKQRPAWVDRCEHYAAAAALTLPEHAQQCAKIARDIRQLLSSADLGPKVATHGDFYEANIYVNSVTRRVSGLLDLDSLGPGYRVNDWGCLLGHMSVLPTLAPKIYDGVQSITDDWYQILGSSVDEAALAASAAGTALSLVAGARKSRVKWKVEALNRLTAAQAWVDRGFAVR
ncbi:phosphotransferase [Arcanobacterium hippocoleae]